MRCKHCQGRTLMVEDTAHNGSVAGSSPVGLNRLRVLL